MDTLGDSHDQFRSSLEVLRKATAILILTTMYESRNLITLLDATLRIRSERIDHAAEITADDHAGWSHEGDVLPVGRVHGYRIDFDQGFVGLGLGRLD